jgi:hypothetical protein
MRPGNPFGDHGQRAVMLALIFEPVLANEDGVGVPAPPAYYYRPGLWGGIRIKGPASLLESFSQAPQAAPQCPACPAGSTLLELMGEGSDQQIAAETPRRAGAMHLPPDKPQFGCRPIEQLANLAVELGDICIARSLAPVAEATGNGRRLARAMASRRVVGRRRHTLPGSLMR